MLFSNSITTDTSGNVGIGTTPSYKLDVSGTSNATALAIAGAVTLRTGTGSPEGVVTAPVGSQYFRTDGGIGTTLYVKQTGSGNTGWTAINSAASLTSVTNGTSNMTVALNAEITFTTAGSERARFATAGQMLIGITSSRSFAGGAQPTVQIEGTAAANATLSVMRNSTDGAHPAYLVLAKSRSATVGGNTSVQSGDQIGQILFQAADGTDTQNIVAQIGVYVDGATGTDDTPGRIAFFTTPDASNTSIERLRINSSGNVVLKSAVSSEQQLIWELTGRNVYLYARDSDDQFGLYDSVLAANRWYTDTTGNFVATGDVTAFSDARLKTDIQKIDNALSKVSQMNGYTYTRTDTGARQAGVIAQEVAKVLPEVVKDDGTQLSVAYGNMVGLLIEAIKELSEKVSELEKKVN